MQFVARALHDDVNVSTARADNQLVAVLEPRRLPLRAESNGVFGGKAAALLGRCRGASNPRLAAFTIGGTYAEARRRGPITRSMLRSGVSRPVVVVVPEIPGFPTVNQPAAASAGRPALSDKPCPLLAEGEVLRAIATVFHRESGHVRQSYLEIGGISKLARGRAGAT
jgi:hypothetical protein